MYDVIIVGAGPAGLSAALLLGRCRRRVLVCDDGRPRNAASHGVHAFLTRDGALPGELRDAGRAQLAPYGVELRGARVEDARREPDGFAVTLDGGATERCRALLLATGVVDRLPDVPGFAALYGTSAHTCPFCDGWEHRGRALVAYARGDGAADFALGLRAWSDDVMLCTDGGGGPEGDDAARLARHGVTVRNERVARLVGREGRLDRVEFEGGESVRREALFFHLGADQRSDLAARLGCVVTDEAGVVTGRREDTRVPGLYVAGDASKDVALAIVAAAEGATAACAIHRMLREKDFA